MSIHIASGLKDFFFSNRRLNTAHQVLQFVWAKCAASPASLQVPHQLTRGFPPWLSFVSFSRFFRFRLHSGQLLRHGSGRR